jgi:hypothetical protein
MERIVIEVSPNVARAWRNAPENKRKMLGNEVSMRIGKELLKGSKEEYVQYIRELQQSMKERGLTQEILDEILHEDEVR